MFVGGCVLARQLAAVALPGMTLGVGHMSKAVLADAAGINWELFARVFYFAVAVFLVGYLVAWLKVGEIPLLSAEPDSARLRFIGASTLTNMAWFFGPTALMLAAEYLLFARVEIRRRRLVGAWAAFVLVVYLTYLTRVDLFRAVVFALLLYHYGCRELRLKHIAVVALVGIGMFAAFALVRSGTETLSVLRESAGVNLPPQLSLLAQFYTYVVGNFWNMDFAFRQYVDGYRSYPYEWGFELFRPMLQLLQLEPAITQSYGLDGVFNASIMRFGVSNSTNFVWHFYKDFGVLSAYGYSLLAGFFAAVFYYNTLARPSLLRVSLWCLIAGVILFSVTTAFWTMWFVYMNAVMLLIAHGKSAVIGAPAASSFVHRACVAQANKART
jgi:oligosaccharide repeat unit polymerase